MNLFGKKRLIGIFVCLLICTICFGGCAKREAITDEQALADSEILAVENPDLGEPQDMAGQAFQTAKSLSTPPIQYISCKDDETGSSDAMKGTVIVSYKYSGRTTTNRFTDRCNGRDVIEYYCENQYLRTKVIKCSQGCKDGVCGNITVPNQTSAKPLPTTDQKPVQPVGPACVDTDGGLNYETKGIVITSTRNLTDYCDASVSSKYMFEYYCANSSYSVKAYSCTVVCKDGACVNATTSAAVVLNATAKKSVLNISLFQDDGQLVFGNMYDYPISIPLSDNDRFVTLGDGKFLGNVDFFQNQLSMVVEDSFCRGKSDAEDCEGVMMLAVDAIDHRPMVLELENVDLAKSTYDLQDINTRRLFSNLQFNSTVNISNAFVKLVLYDSGKSLFADLLGDIADIRDKDGLRFWLMPNGTSFSIALIHGVGMNSSEVGRFVIGVDSDGDMIIGEPIGFSMSEKSKGSDILVGKDKFGLGLSFEYDRSKRTVLEVTRDT